MTASDHHALRLLHHELGIAPDYGQDPFLPYFAESKLLTAVGADVFGRPQRLAPNTATAWQRMREAAANDGVALFLVSGFRGYDYQANLFRDKLRRGQSITAILKVNAAPGYSQHHTGLALDLTSGDDIAPLTEQFTETDAFRWLRLRAGEFGFNMPYPRNNPYGFCYEPWHWSQVPEADRGMA